VIEQLPTPLDLAPDIEMNAYYNHVIGEHELICTESISVAYAVYIDSSDIVLDTQWFDLFDVDGQSKLPLSNLRANRF
jgi:hypothetical protein